MKKLYLLCIFISANCFCMAQLQGINISSIPGCGGATLVPQPLWGATTNPASLHYEKQSGANWVEVLMQPYVNNANWMIITASDISVATLYRVRAVDDVTGQEFISNGTTVNPVTWNVDRGIPSVINNTYWGGNCANQFSYVTVDVNYTVAGRPPFTIEYKKSTETNYTIAGTGVYGFKIDNLDKSANYNIRVTDFCGKISNTAAFRPVISLESYVIDPTTCNNGLIRLSVSNDGRYSGYPPYTFSLGKRYPNMTEARPPSNYVSSGDFNALTPGNYYSEVKDACGNYAAIPIIELGGGFPAINYTGVPTIPNGDSCLRDFALIPVRGREPFTYGYRFQNVPDYNWQNSNVLENLDRNGNYFIQFKDACGQIGDDAVRFISIPPAQITTVTPLSNNCVTDIIVKASNGAGYKPFEYGIRKPGTSNFVYQTSDTLKNIGSGPYEIVIKDRCGNVSATFTYNGNSNCAIQSVTGVYESAGSTQGCQDYSGTGWIDVKDDNNFLICSINPNNNVLPQVCWGMNIVNAFGGSLRNTNINGKTTYFLDRNFYIEPQAGTVLTSPVSLRIYITNSELLNMLNYLNSNGITATVNDLRILKKKGTATSPVSLDVVSDSVADPSQFTIIQPLIRSYGTDWYMEFSVNDFSEFNPSFSAQSALPLQLLAFTASIQQGNAVLHWKTDREINTANFDIERSEDGNRFNTIGKVNAFGFSASVRNYNFEDPLPLNAKNYYRLKMVDADGKYTYSKVILVRAENASGFTISPNPVINSLTLSYHNMHPIFVSITDASGRMVRQQKINNAGSIQINTTSLAKGWYVLELQSKEATIRQSFLKQ